MGICGSSNKHQGISIMYNGQVIKLKGDDYDFDKLIDLVNQRTEKKSSVLSISNSGNAFRLKNENDLNSLKMAKSQNGRILLMVAPEELLDIFNITKVGDKELDKGFEAVNIKLKSLLVKIAEFDKYFNLLVKSLSVMFVRSCNISTTITSLIVLLTPYLQELISDPPYIKVSDQAKQIMPIKIKEINDIWERVLSIMEKVEEHLTTLDNNLRFLLGGRVGKRLTIMSGQKLHKKAFKIAENNVKVHKSLEKVIDIESKIRYFKDSVIQSINIYGDRRIQIVKRITLIGEMCIIDSPHQISWVFGLGDYSIIPSGIRFMPTYSFQLKDRLRSDEKIREIVK